MVKLSWLSGRIGAFFLYLLYCVGGWKSRLWRNRDSLDGKQARIVKEILDSEKRYVQCLGILCRVFLQPLNESLESEEPILKEKEIRAIFSYAEVIHNLNVNFYQELQKAAGEPNSISNIGKLFFRHSEFFKMYSTFINGYNVALFTLSKCKQDNEQFSIFLEESEGNPECEKLDLTSFLIMPVQRLPRYVLLLKDLVANTPSDHLGYTQLVKGLEKIKAVADHINESKRSAENSQQVFEIHQSVVGNSQPIALPHRIFHSESDVLIRTANNKIQKIHYFLFNDSILLATSSGSLFMKNKKWKSYDQLDLDAVDIVDVDDTKESQNALYLSTPQSKHFIILDSPEKKESIMNTISSLKSHPNSLPQTISNEAKEKKLEKKWISVGVVGAFVLLVVGLLRWKEMESGVVHVAGPSWRANFDDLIVRFK